MKPARLRRQPKSPMGYVLKCRPLQIALCSAKLHHMRRIIFLLFLVIALAAGKEKATSNVSRRIPCKTPSNAASCYWIHGRLGSYNGTPAFRLWKIGTHRLLGIYSGPSADLYGEDNEDPEFPKNVRRAFKPFTNRIFADFEVCPLEPKRESAMQAACIEAAKNILVEK